MEVSLVTQGRPFPGDRSSEQKTANDPPTKRSTGLLKKMHSFSSCGGGGTSDEASSSKPTKDPKSNPNNIISVNIANFKVNPEKILVTPNDLETIE
ncbi:uncharacterized protein LOC126845501 isoform X10 [Adelges cooleyi]|nr:uncharacterized protein LOC126845501 isoform X7 [Adelges cooleyi]XP_050440112.1 uncharacterized protein LOC126845501 isoform X8 [Adelges cooleyi]XP_050440113.1 uncharacterized protein LOC126845501 isoform X9 [Adelges cooleyi]XP_050440114.1 uncharacterized protein LOC126845501 isoform X10 [Adelges cooleyi]